MTAQHINTCKPSPTTNTIMGRMVRRNIGDKEKFPTPSKAIEKSANHFNCYCGGPGGHPGMQPVCISCLRFNRILREANARTVDQHSRKTHL